MKDFWVVVALILISTSPAYAGKWSTGTTAPAICTVGDSWTDTNGTPDNRFYTCTSTNTWTLNSNQTAIDAKADKLQAVRYWADHPNGTQIAAKTIVAYDGKLYTTLQAFDKVSSSATPDVLTAYFEPIAGATYTLPSATTETKGGIIVGDRLTVTADGVLSADVQTTDISGKQDTLVSGTNIKTVNSTSLLGSGNIDISGSSVPDGTVDGQVLLWATDQWVASTAPWLTTALLSTENTWTAVQNFNSGLTATGLTQNLTSWGDWTFGGTQIVNASGTGDNQIWPASKNISELAGKQATLVSGANIKTISGQDITGSGNIDIAGGYVSLSAVPYSDDTCTTGQYGYFESTAYLCTGGFWASKWTLSAHSNPTPATYSLALTLLGVSGTDKMTINGGDYSASGIVSGLSSATTALTGVPDVGRVVECTGDVTGTAPNYLVDMSSANKSASCTFSAYAGPSFVGAPGEIESFEAPGASLPEISKVDADGYINLSSSTSAHAGAYSVEFANTTAAATYTNYVIADIGAPEESYTLSWWWKTPNNGTVYTNAVIWVASANNTLVSSTAKNGQVSWDGQGTGGKLWFSYLGTGGASPLSSIMSYNTWYRLVVRMTNNSNASYLDIYNSSNTLVETLQLTAAYDKPIRYFFWLDDTGVGENTYMDEVQYDSTNP